MSETSGFQKMPAQPAVAIEVATIYRLLTEEHRAGMRIGLTEFSPGVVETELEYDEALFMLEGEIDIESAGTLQTLRPGELLWMLRGRKLVYRAKAPCRFLYAIPTARAAS